MTWTRFIKRKKTVTLGGRRVPVKPLSLEDALRLLLLLAPHLAHLEARWPEIRAALASTNGQRPQLLTAVFTALRDELASAPGDMTRALGLMTGLDPAWLAANASAREFVAALPVLDEVNDFTGLWYALKALGLDIGYGKPGTD